MTILILFFLFFSSIHGFHKMFSTRLFKSSYMQMTNDKYQFAKDYYNFYRKYREPIIQTTETEFDYDSFVEKNKERYLLFEKNMQTIRDTNLYLKNQNNSFTIDINKYADIIDFDSDNTYDLMKEPITDLFKPEAYFKIFQTPFPYLETIFNQNNKLTYNWNSTGLLSPVKNQGRCGSCWAFSATSALETFMRINGYNITRLSEQELVDCSKENYGCNGGLMDLAFDYIIKKGGLLSYDKYPYVAKDQNCTRKTLLPSLGSHLSKYQYTIPKSILDMKINVIQTPISIALDANNIFFRFYKEGVIDINQNRTGVLNHAVLLVGFDYDDNGMYWIIQNSWGPEWGDRGFCKIRAVPGDGILLCQQYGVYPTKIYDPSNDRLNYEI